MYFNIKCIGKWREPTNEFERSLVFKTGEFERPKFDCIIESYMFFHALTFAGSRGRCLNTKLIGPVLNHLLRDPASVNEMKQECVIVILAFFTLFQPNLL